MSAAPMEASRPDVVLITIDTWRADYAGFTGGGKVLTPSLDALAADGVWFDNAYSQVPLTPPSHASILTGTYPATHGIRDFTSGPISQDTVSLASILKTNGYGTAAFVSALVLDSVWGLDRGFDVYDDDFPLLNRTDVNPGNVQRSAGETMDRVLNWLKTAPKPSFLWVHLFDPHHDYVPPEPFRDRYASDPYAGEVAYADSQIGRLMQALKASGRYDGAMIIATSDHGESLGEHSEPNHGFFVYETTLHIPLIAKLPASEEAGGGRRSQLAQSVDILPTILQVLGIRRDPSWPIEGRGLLSAILGKGDPNRFAYGETLYPRDTFGWSPLYAYREGRYKLIDSTRPELFDLEADPLEDHDLYGTRRALGDQLRSKLTAVRRRAIHASAKSATEDPEAIERLSALGYVALAGPVPVADEGGLPDPKDKLGIYRTVVRALTAAEAGDPRTSNSLLEEVASKEPGLFIVHYSIGLNLLGMGRPGPALEALEQARRLNPSYDSIDLNRAKALAALQRSQEGIDVLRALLERNPAFPAARMQLAAMLRHQGRLEEALAEYRRLANDRPKDARLLEILGITLVEGEDYAAGLKRLDQAAALNPPDALLWNHRAIALTNLGRLDEAIEDYRKALTVKPDYHQARLNLAFALARRGQIDEARTEFQKVCEGDRKLCGRYQESFRRLVER